MDTEDRETLNWLKEIGSRGFERRPWYLESKNHNQHGRDGHIHTRPGCTRIHASGVVEKIVTAILDETSNTGHLELDGSLPTGHLCIECGYGFLYNRSSLNIRQQAQRLQRMAKQVAQLEHPSIEVGSAEMLQNTLSARRWPGCEPHLISDHTPALQGLLVQNYIKTLRDELYSVTVNKNLQFAKTALEQSMEQMCAKFPLDTKTALNDAMLLGAKYLIQQTIYTHMSDPKKKPHIDWKRISATHMRSIGHIQNEWLDNITNLDDSTASDTAVHSSNEYRGLSETLPVIDDIIAFWKHTFRRITKRRETTFFTVEHPSGFMVKPPATARVAVISQGVRVIDEKHGCGFGEMPLLAAYWVTAAPHEWYVPVIKIVRHKHRQLTDDHWAILKALWDEAKNDPTNLYREPVHLFRAAATL